MESYIENLSKIGRICHYKTSNIIFFEGEMPKKIFVLLKGKVRLCKACGSANKHIHTLESPCFIAEMPSLTNQIYPASAICVNDCEILAIKIENFRKSILENSEFCFSLIASLCQKIGILERYITQNSNNLTQKLVKFILENSDNLPTQRKIAEILNSNPQSISRILKSLKQRNAIAINKGKIAILDSAKLSEIYDKT